MGHSSQDHNLASTSRRSSEDAPRRSVAPGKRTRTESMPGPAAPVQRKGDGTVHTLAELEPVADESTSVPELLAQIQQVIEEGRRSIRFPGRGYHLDNDSVEDPAPNPALSSPRLKSLLVLLCKKLAQEVAAASASSAGPARFPGPGYDLRTGAIAVEAEPGPPPPVVSMPGRGHVLGTGEVVEPVPVQPDALASATIAELIHRARELQQAIEESRQAPAPAAFVPFSGPGHRLGGDRRFDEVRPDARPPGQSLDRPPGGEGHVLGGELSREEWLARLPGPDRPPGSARRAEPEQVSPVDRPEAPARRQGALAQGSVAHGDRGGSSSATQRAPGGSSTVVEVISESLDVSSVLGGVAASLGLQEGPEASQGSAPAQAPEERASSARAEPDLSDLAPPEQSADGNSAAIVAYRRHIRNGGWASEAELANLAQAAGVKLVIHHYSPEGVYLYSTTAGAGRAVHLRHMNNHYDLFDARGGIVRIPGDGNCGFAAFFRGVTGLMPYEENIRELREHAADNLSDEQVENILAAMDAQDVDMGRGELAATGSGGDRDAVALVLAYLALVDEMSESDPDPSGPSSSVVEEEDGVDSFVLDLVIEAIEEGLAAFMRGEDAAVERELAEILARESEEDDESVEADSAEPGPQSAPVLSLRPPGAQKSGSKPPGGDPGPASVHSESSRPAPALPGTVKTRIKHQGGFRSQLVDTVDKVTDATGHVGTEGANNFGGKDEVFGGVVEDLVGSKGDAAISGNSDIASALNDAVAIGVTLGKAIKVLKDDDASPEAKAKASVDIAASVTGFVGANGKLLGGVFHQIEEIGGQSNSSSFGFTADGGSTLATDAKLVGDAAGVVTNLLGMIGQAIELMESVRSGEFTRGSKQEVAGRVVRTVAEASRTLMGTAKTLGQLVGQIQGGGQIAADFGGSAFKTFGGSVVPGVGAAVSAINIGRQSYNIHKFRMRRQRLKDKLIRERLSKKQRRAIELIREVLDKRITRAGIDIGLDSVALVGNVVQAATPVGTATGIALNATTGLARLGIVGTRVVKQGLRNRKASQREEQGLSESYKDWRQRQKDKHTLKASLNVVFTPNWDKSSKEKARMYLQNALVIVEMDDAEVYESLGLDQSALAELDTQGKVDKIIAALRKR